MGEAENELDVRQAFLSRDYEGCVERALRAIEEEPTFECWHLLIICYQRLGWGDAAAWHYAMALASCASQRWHHALLRLTLDKADFGEVSDLAGGVNPIRQCQLAYYAGARLLLQNSAEAARAANMLLSMCAETGPDCPEREFARADLASPPTLPLSPDSPDIRQVNKMNVEVVALYQQGRLQEGRNFATRALGLARRCSPADHRLTLTCLVNLARVRFDLGELPAAESLYREAVDLAAESLGERHPDHAGCLTHLGELYRTIGRNSEAESLLRRALNILERSVGKHGRRYGATLSGLAVLYQEAGRLTEAEQTFRLSLEVARDDCDEGYAGIAVTIDNLAQCCRAVGKLAEAEILHEEAYEMRRKVLGDSHPGLLLSLNYLAEVYRAQGNFARAEPLYRQALALVRGRSDGPQRHTADIVCNLGELCEDTGRYAEAEAYFREALELWSSDLGENHPQYARCLSNLANVRQALNDLSSARALHRQALEIRRTALGEDHQDVAESLNNLANVYVAMNNAAEAEPLYRKALDICETTLGRSHSSTLACLNNLGRFHLRQGDAEAAERLLRRAQGVARELLGDRHPRYATSLNNLAALYHGTARYAEAESLYSEASEICRATLGEAHPHYAASLNNLAGIRRSLGDSQQAEALYRRALEIGERALGEHHPDLALGWTNLAGLQAAIGQRTDACESLERAATIQDRALEHVFSVSSEAQRLSFLATLREHLAVYLTLASAQLGTGSSLINKVWRLVLRRKAIVAKSLAVQREAALSGEDADLADLFRAWDDVRSQVARCILDGPGPIDPAAHRERINSLTARKKDLEERLAHRVQGQILPAIEDLAVAKALPAGSALIEFVRHEVVDFTAVPSRGELTHKPSAYVAFVMLASKPESLTMIPLGEAEAIDTLVARTRDAIALHDYRDAERHVTPDIKRATVPETFAAVGSRLRATAFDTIVRHLDGRTRLLIAPDGGLSRLPFEVLPTQDGGYLIDRYVISYLSCGRDVLGPHASPDSKTSPPWVIADPDFNLGAEVGSVARDGPLRGRRSRDLDRDRIHFRALPETRQEGERIAACLGVEPMLGATVLERRLKEQCRSPIILHLATHGFFMEDQESQFVRQSSVPPQAARVTGRMSGALPENPLLRSGLALAGANIWLAGGTPPLDAEDGLLTAEDVAGLDLRRTEMVVLSACDTGLGEVRVGEGVFGLRRAFVLAGARTLVMSLWKVPDKPTRELMEDYYFRLASGVPRALALREAQLKLKERNPAPRDWGAFICQGDSGPIQTSLYWEWPSTPND